MTPKRKPARAVAPIDPVGPVAVRVTFNVPVSSSASAPYAGAAT